MAPTQQPFCCILVTLLLALGVSCVNLPVHQQQQQPPLHSKKSPSETISVYEVVEPDITYSEEQMHNGYSEEIFVAIRSKSKTYNLKLQLNKHLLSPEFTSGYHHNGGKIHEKHDNCFYHGTVEGHKDWSAVFSTCYGLRGWFGSLHDSSNLYHIEPMEDTSSLTGPHALYMDSQHQNNKPGTCGTGEKHEIKNPSIEGLPDTKDLHSLKRRQSSGEPLIVEWLLVNDFNQYVNYNRNLSAVAHRAIELANQVDLLYQPLNVRIVLVHSLTWTNGQEIQATTDSNLLLDYFADYHRTNTELQDIVHDSAMLITGIDIAGSTVGVAFLNRMCVYAESVGFTQDTGSSIMSVGGIAAHELGHIFNMQHDDSPGCQCPDTNSGCIMHATLGFPPPSQFSQCSRNQLQEGLEVFNRGVCLTNNPTVIFGDPACGNGIKEPGEVCDCGSLEECRDPCCNATSCTLSEGSSCAEGECCDNCQFKSYGTTCRESGGDCGITEYCTGTSSDCPRDVYLQNGSPCENNASFCYDGLCASLTDQCTTYYGEESAPSVPDCYSEYNVQGVGYGHCGAANNAFIPCLANNVGCGSIQCEGGSIDTSNINFQSTLTYYSRSVSYEGGIRGCQTFSTGATVDEVSPGLVLDGTKCGNEMLCISQECVSITSLGVTPCPVGSNGEVCSGYGVCNNLDQCSCIIGRNGTDCSELSNRQADKNSNRSNPGVIAGTVIGVLIVMVALLVGIVLLIVFIVYRSKQNKHFSPSRSTKFNSDNRARRPVGAHGSTDDLLMTGIKPSGTSPTPPASNSNQPTSYKPYVPPVYTPPSGPSSSPSVTTNKNIAYVPQSGPSSSPSVTVNQNIRRPPPTAPNNYSSRPPPPTRTAPTNANKPNPPPSRPTPPTSRPTPPTSRPIPPTNKPLPPVSKPGQSTKPTPSPRPSQPPPSKVPQTAPKPSKIAMQWPPPSQDNSSAPAKPPILPRKQ